MNKKENSSKQAAANNAKEETVNRKLSKEELKQVSGGTWIRDYTPVRK